MASELLFAGDQIGIQMDEEDATKLLGVANDFRKPAEIRRLAMRLYGQTCATKAASFRAITEEFGSHDPQRRLSAYRAGRRLLQRCRERFDVVLLVVEALEEAKDALIRGWERDFSALGERGDGTGLREMRNLLVDIESTLGAYQEFAERMTAEDFVETSEEAGGFQTCFRRGAVRCQFGTKVLALRWLRARWRAGSRRWARPSSGTSTARPWVADMLDGMAGPPPSRLTDLRAWQRRGERQQSLAG